MDERLSEGGWMKRLIAGRKPYNLMVNSEVRVPTYLGPHPSLRLQRYDSQGEPNPSRLGDSCLLLKHISPTYHPRNKQFRLLIYQHTHPFSQAIQQSLQPRHNLTCLLGALRVRAQLRGKVLRASSSYYTLRPTGGFNSYFTLPIRVSL